MKSWGKKGPENVNRSEAVKLLEACDIYLRSAFQDLAEAGMPRAAKPHRTKAIESARASFDSARARLTNARYHFSRCLERVTDHAEPHAKASVTQLAPLIRTATAEVQTLRRFLVAYASESFARRSHVEELREAGELRTSLFSSDDGMRHRCNWCAEVERYADSHYPLDAEGFAVKRKKAVRFCCYSCFTDGKDLREPAPKALPPVLPLERARPAETVACVPVAQPRLSANGSAHVD